ncbi:clathrin-coated vesicle protein [Salix suchowensis]|nr:clathrin-coated vesicle protein [Salix suchowensis]
MATQLLKRAGDHDLKVAGVERPSCPSAPTSYDLTCRSYSSSNANMSGDFSAYPVICQILDAIITVLGTDIQESPRTRALILNLVQEFSAEGDDNIRVESIQCIQHFLMSAPEFVDIPRLVTRFMGYLASPRRPIKLVADAASRQNMRDDEGESLNVGASSVAPGGSAGYQTSRWRTKLFALQCVHLICATVAKSGRREQLDAVISRTLGLPTAGLLVSRVPDLSKMAFTASTAYVTEIGLEGLVVLRDVIETFSKAADPAYEDSLLLEQHQAPITAALTPSFSSDSTPEILESAVHARAVFVGCGVVKDVGRMGRILKLLTTALDHSKGKPDPCLTRSDQFSTRRVESGMVSLGDTRQLSPNASSMLRISTLSAWAQLEIASAQQPYLVQVVNPHLSTLATLWVAALRDYASVRIDTEFLHDSSSVAVDSSYSSLVKEVLLPVRLFSRYIPKNMDAD